jgi:hypothetical protein
MIISLSYCGAYTSPLPLSVLEFTGARLAHRFILWMSGKFGYSFRHVPMARLWAALCSRRRSAAMARSIACVARQLREVLLRPSSLRSRIRPLS